MEPLEKNYFDADDLCAVIKKGGSHQCLILLIDDDPLVAEALNEMIKPDPHIKMHYCADPGMALDMATEIKPTVILLDMVMQDIDGIAVLRYLRASEGIKNIPIVALSSKEEASVKADVFANGGDDYLVKFPDEIEVLARIRYHSKSYTHLLQRDEAFESLRISQQKLTESNIKLHRLASIDMLTGIANRRKFDDTVRREWQRLRREKSPLSIILADIDFFKHCNDIHGHLYGDEVLQKVALALERAIKRPADLVARFGGEEFIVMLPNTDREGAMQLAEELRLVIESMKLEHKGSELGQHLTISLGVASAMPSGGERGYEALIKEADEALYKAKALGRNRCCFLTKHEKPRCA